jgi:histone H1/5
MSATGEVVDISPAVEQPPEVVKAAEEPKPVKEKKPKASKEKKPKQTKTTSHPPYFQVITSINLIQFRVS